MKNGVSPQACSVFVAKHCFIIFGNVCDNYL